jgi:hypothetical protein
MLNIEAYNLHHPSVSSIERGVFKHQTEQTLVEQIEEARRRIADLAPIQVPTELSQSDYVNRLHDDVTHAPATTTPEILPFQKDAHNVMTVATRASRACRRRFIVQTSIVGSLR